MKRPKHLIVLSLDSLSSNEFQIAKNYKGFKALIENGSYIEKVETIYPSLTYPAHTTVITGRYPKNHGIVSNKILDEGVTDRDWYWYRKYISGDTLYDAARRDGLKTAALLWPVAANAKINYNLPEIWANKKCENDAIKILSSGTKSYILDLQLRFGKLRQGIKQPFLDEFVCASSQYTIKSKKPNLMLVHFIDLDTQKHEHGINSNEVKDSLIRIDKKIQRIISSVKEAGIYEETAIVAFGDHSQLDAHTKIKPNVRFLENDLIRISPKGKVESYDAYFDSCDGSGYVYVQNRNYLNKVHDILQNMNDQGIVENIYSTEEAASLGANSNCSFMIEAKKGYFFSDEIYGDFLQEISPPVGQHGYSPLKSDYTTVFIASGKGIKKGVKLQSGHLINHGKTLAALLGVNLKEAEGRVITEILDV